MKVRHASRSADGLIERRTSITRSQKARKAEGMAQIEPRQAQERGALTESAAHADRDCTASIHRSTGQPATLRETRHCLKIEFNTRASEIVARGRRRQEEGVRSVEWKPIQEDFTRSNAPRRHRQGPPGKPADTYRNTGRGQHHRGGSGTTENSEDQPHSDTASRRSKRKNDSFSSPRGKRPTDHGPQNTVNPVLSERFS